MLNEGILFPNPKPVAPFCLQIGVTFFLLQPPRRANPAARSKSRPSRSSEAASLLPFGAATMGFGGYLGNSRVDSSLTSTCYPEAASVHMEIGKRITRQRLETGDRDADVEQRRAFQNLIYVSNLGFGQASGFLLPWKRVLKVTDAQILTQFS